MKTLFTALAAFQQEIPALHEGTQGHGYTYASLPEVISKINPILQKHKLGFTQLIKDGQLKTFIFHTESGELLESETDLHFEDLQYVTVIKTNQDGTTYEKEVILGFEGMNRAQAMGSMITYFRRYCLAAMLGLITEVDNDGTGEKKGETTVKKKYADDNRPWLSEKQVKQAVDRISGGEVGVYEKIDKAFKMKKEYREQLKTASKPNK